MTPAKGNCRFCRLYALAVVGFAALLGALTVAQLLLEQLIAPAAAAGAFPLARSALRSLGAAASGSALILALVLWAHPLSAPRLQQDLRKTLTRGLLATLPGFVVAAVVAAVTGAIVVLASGRGSASFAFTATDVLAGALLAVIDAGLILFLSARFLPRLSASRLSLPGKLVVVLTASVALRASFGLLAGSALSG